LENRVILNTKGLTKAFGALLAINRVDFTVESGKIKGLIGPNGAGKTTLFNLITSHTKKTSGKVMFYGEDISDFPNRKIVSRGIARTFQITNIFENLSCIENIILGGLRPTKVDRKFWSDYRKRGVFEYDYVGEICELIKLEKAKLNEKAGLLSYPEQRLLEIGIALATRPKLLLLDEPLAGLGAESVEDIKIAIKEIGKEIDMVIVDHNLDAIIAVSEIITVMHYGEILFEGSPEEVKSNKEIERVYLKG
jgi:branched-chain amino acid transport system ATP-binding protein